MFATPVRNIYLLKKTKQPATAPTQQVIPKTSDSENGKDFLLCTVCQNPITRHRDRIEQNGAHQHVFANPHGYVYQIGCFAQAPGCAAIGQETSYFSWFSGYKWRVALCNRCLTLLGWAFRSGESHFFGLIVDKLMETS
jgi:hypothetical protein